MDSPQPSLSVCSSLAKQNPTPLELLRVSRQKMFTEGTLETVRLGRILGHTSVVEKVSNWIRHTTRTSHHVDNLELDDSDDDSDDDSSDDSSDDDSSTTSTTITPIIRRIPLPSPTLGPHQGRPFRQSQETLNIRRGRIPHRGTQDKPTIRNKYDDKQGDEFDAQRRSLFEGNRNEYQEEDAGYSSSNIDKTATDAKIEDAFTFQPLDGMTNYISDDIWAFCPPTLSHTNYSSSDGDTSRSYGLQEPRSRKSNITVMI